MDYNDKALEGFQLVLNNKWHLAQSIFMKHKDESNLMMGGAALVLTMDFFLSGSSSNQQMAKECSLEVIRKCKASNKLLRSSNAPADVLDYIGNEVLSVQCQVIHSILSVAQSSDIVSSCWNFKQAWQQHKKIYREWVAYVLSQSAGSLSHELQGQSAGRQSGNRTETCRSEKRSSVDANADPGSECGDPFEGLSSEFMSMVGVCDLQFKMHSEPWQSKRKKSRMMELLGLSRVTICGRDCTKLTFEPRLVSVLIGQLSLGYGLFLMAFHLVPQSASLQVLMHLFGFRDTQGPDGAQGMVEKFMLSALSQSCFSSFSCCLLLHYLLVTRPLMIMNSNNLATAREMPKVQLLLGKLKSSVEHSMFYFYFVGKFHLVKGELKEAARNFEKGVKSVEGDFKFICNYELGRCKMVMFDWLNAAKTFDEMRKRMPIMIAYHVYVAAVTFGAAGNSRECNKLLQMINSHSRHKRKELSEFFGARVLHWYAPGGVGSVPGKEVCVLLCLELLYLWNIIHVCSKEHLTAMLHFCQQHKKKFDKCDTKKVKDRNKTGSDLSFAPLRQFMEAVIAKELQKKGSIKGREEIGSMEEAEKLFVECLDHSRSSPSKPEEHVSAFAAYELGLLKLKQGDLRTSKEYFTKVKLHDAKHLFFKNKMSSDLEKLFADSGKGRNLDIGSASDEKKFDLKERKPLSSRFKDFFLQSERVVPTTPDRSDPPEWLPDKDFLHPSVKISPRKCLIRTNGVEDEIGDVGDDVGDNPSITRSCVLQ